MMLVLGVWAFVRALLVNSAARWRMSSSVINWRCCSDQSVAPGSDAGTGSSG
jgi:hypothetical protein